MLALMMETEIAMKCILKCAAKNWFILVAFDKLRFEFPAMTITTERKSQIGCELDFGGIGRIENKL